MTAAIHTGSDLIAGSPQPLFQLDSGPAPNRFAVSADGRRFLMAAPEEVGTDEVGIMMVLNWAADLGYNH
jgi:hypothetical protein